MKSINCISAVLVLVVLSACSAKEAHVDSPSENIRVSFFLDGEGRPTYEVCFKDSVVVAPSHMGFVVNDGDSLTSGFTIENIEYASHRGTWAPVWGENDSIAENYNSLIVSLKHKGAWALGIEFKVFDDGMAYRYTLAEGPDSIATIVSEESSFAMTGDHTAWWLPGDFDSQEYEYTCSRLSEIRSHAGDDFKPGVSSCMFSPTGVQTSLLMRTDSGLYLNIHEASLVDYPVLHLEYDDAARVFRSRHAPRQSGGIARVKLPFATPWRALMIGEKSTDILASNLILNLNEPCALDDTSWIHPVKYMGVWWEMIVGLSLWSYTDASNIDLNTYDYSKAIPHGKHGANTENVCRYIDFAAGNNFDELLVEGWNIGWEDWFDMQKDFVFDFVTPYPDFDIKRISDYARSKGIKIMMHHETSSSLDNYTRRLDDAYKLMSDYGYDAVKSGYVGRLLPDGEHHDGQYMVNHLNHALTKAADYHIMVNTHEGVHPTGLCRTYPNLVGGECAKGQEFGDMSTAHVTILPFTRLKGGPMDFTPGIFRMDITSFAQGWERNRKKNATIVNQLALYCTMYSPLQMACDIPANYLRHADAFQFIKEVPVDWSRSVYLDAEPGEFLVAARKDKHSDNWFVGGVNAETPREYTVNLSFLDGGRQYKATVYTDADDADAYTNPEKYRIDEYTVTSDSTLAMRMARGGGFAVSLYPQD